MRKKISATLLVLLIFSGSGCEKIGTAEFEAAQAKIGEQESDSDSSDESSSESDSPDISFSGLDSIDQIA